jgi:dinuclear metal center YbgI/SA1388 family protein
MVSAGDVYRIIDYLAPFDAAEEFDNVGILVDTGKKTENILFALDATDEVIDEAIEKNCGIIVSHHPVIFEGIKRINKKTPAYKAAFNDISVISAHTSLDIAEGGINDVLAETLGLIVEGRYCDGIGRFGHFRTEKNPLEFVELVKTRLKTGEISCVLGNRSIKRVAVGGGSYKFVKAAIAIDVDAVVTGEIKYDAALEAKGCGITAIAAGHYHTEVVGMVDLMGRVQSLLSNKAKCFFTETKENPFELL